MKAPPCSAGCQRPSGMAPVGERSVLILYFFVMGKLPDTAVSVEYQSQLKDRLFRQCVPVFTGLYLPDRLT